MEIDTNQRVLLVKNGIRYTIKFNKDGELILGNKINEI